MLFSVGEKSREFGRCSQVLHARSARHSWQGIGPLSIKCFLNGSAMYNVGRGCYSVDDRRYLVLNRDQNYSITIESKTVVESFCVFFAPGFVEEVHHSLSKTTSELLDQPSAITLNRLEFFEKTYPHDSFVSPKLFALKSALPSLGAEALWLESRLHEIAHALLLAHERERQRVRSVAALRASTREELYRRLHRSRDYILAMYNQPIDLQMLAGVACLSPNHFLRTFAQVFGQTPHQFLMTTRLTKAHELLASSDISVTEVSLTVGFESLGSFSSLFRRHFGFPPSSLSKKVIMKKTFSR